MVHITFLFFRFDDVYGCLGVAVDGVDEVDV